VFIDIYMCFYLQILTSSCFYFLRDHISIMYIFSRSYYYLN